jgi:hypothetical protein
MAANTVFSNGFFRDKGLDYQTRTVLGRAVHGASDVGEVLAAIERISDHESWRSQWSQTAGRIHAVGDDLRAGGELLGAQSAYLRAATYWACVVESLSEQDDESALLRAFRAHRQCWDEFVACSRGAHVGVDVPYEGTTLPGYLLRPDDSGTPRPTLVITNGSDGAISGLWSDAGAGAVARGWNAFVYDGPGQQTMLFEHHVPFRPDWEAVLTPVLDTLVARPDVDPTRLTGYGLSQGGYWLPRALAFEHRLVAAVADPGVVDVSTSWTDHLGTSMLKLLEQGDRDAFNRDMKVATMIPGLKRMLTFRARPYQPGEDWFALFEQVREYRLTEELTGQITTPLMITDPEGEQFWPGQSKQLAGMLGERAHRVEFTAAEGANLHCQPLGRALTDERMFSWLASHLVEGRVTT